MLCGEDSLNKTNKSIDIYEGIRSINSEDYPKQTKYKQIWFKDLMDKTCKKKQKNKDQATK